jgi:hypothetical protein
MVPFSRSKRKFRCIRSRIVIRFMLDQRSLFWLCVLLLLPSIVQGSVILSVDAVLSRPDLSVTKPIDFSVNFGTQFASINSLTVTAFWIGDLFDPGEWIFYENLGGYANGGGTVSSRVLTFVPQFNQDILNLFLGGHYNGRILAENNFTTVTFDRLVFAVDGVVVPEASTIWLVLGGFIACTFLPFGASRRVNATRSSEGTGGVLKRQAGLKK